MAGRGKSKAQAKTVMVRTVCIVLAGLMLLSVLGAALWR